ncbi:MAG: hypothetical protein ONB48_20395 [candidate division KSB1 bacterium]|nr:hypothetical protein [candidate division KSB1 bacterium]MDZ7273347.1 hypothetical protein [candidate division KSB1 bacterium]MDZ7288009.1 hypothetical protein [candidate division KSB1 bacterium]MDZ7300139.1 hypothetical protein [candidate division KSB1 bacterium]MDZ7308473.1 hypothetical protein [candidate division KSB1 bacterium]
MDEQQGMRHACAEKFSKYAPQLTISSPKNQAEKWPERNASVMCWDVAQTSCPASLPEFCTQTELISAARNANNRNAQPPRQWGIKNFAGKPAVNSGRGARHTRPFFRTTASQHAKFRHKLFKQSKKLSRKEFFLEHLPNNKPQHHQNHTGRRICSRALGGWRGSKIFTLTVPSPF